MAELLGIVATVATLCTAGVGLRRHGGLGVVVGACLVVTGGAITGVVGALILGLALWPGGCIAVLCPPCYRAPDAEAVARFWSIDLAVLGAVGGLLPSRAFRAGFGLGVVLVLGQSLGRLASDGPASAFIVGIAAFTLAWALRRGLSLVLGGTNDDASPPPTDFWDGDGWAGTSSVVSAHGERRRASA